MESPFRYYDRSAAVQAACQDGPVDSLMARFIRRIRLCTEVCDEVGTFGERGPLDLFFNFGAFLEGWFTDTFLIEFINRFTNA